MRQYRGSWRAYKVCEAELSQPRLVLSSKLSIIRNLIMLRSLLGLIGTMTGMMSVFEVIAFAPGHGSGCVSGHYGWVLVAFTLAPKGKTKNIQILDSQPRGIFEEKVITAVEDWIYDMRDVKVKGGIILTQRIELQWKDYHQNNLRLDL